MSPFPHAVSRQRSPTPQRGFADPSASVFEQLEKTRAKKLSQTTKTEGGFMLAKC